MMPTVVHAGTPSEMLLMAVLGAVQEISPIVIALHFRSGELAAQLVVKLQTQAIIFLLPLSIAVLPGISQDCPRQFTRAVVLGSHTTAEADDAEKAMAQKTIKAKNLMIVAPLLLGIFIAFLFPEPTCSRIRTIARH